MVDRTKTVVVFITLILFLIGSGFTIVGIFNTTDVSPKNIDEKFIIPSQVLNGLTVMFLLYLVSTSTSDPSYKLLVVVMLVGGLMIEIYLTSYSDRQAESIAAYVFIAFNFLVRAFFLIDLSQGEWIKPYTPSVKPIKEAVEKAIVTPVENIVKEVIKPVAEAPKTEAQKEASADLVSKWDSYKNILKSKPEGLDESTQKEAWENIVKPAKKSGRKDVMAVLKEAANVLKDKDGNPIPISSVDAVGGSRK